MPGLGRIWTSVCPHVRSRLASRHKSWHEASPSASTLCLHEFPEVCLVKACATAWEIPPPPLRTGNGKAQGLDLPIRSKRVKFGPLFILFYYRVVCTERSNTDGSVSEVGYQWFPTQWDAIFGSSMCMRPPEMPMAKPAGGGNLTPSSDLCDRTDPPKSPSS